MEYKYEVEKALTRARSKRKVLKRDLALKLFPQNEAESTRQVKLTRILNGEVSRLTAEQINIICDFLGCSADFLVGRTDD